MMKSALPFYRKLVEELRDMGFEVNPHNPCVANRIVNGSQITVRWHVDDFMINHIDQDEISKLLTMIKHIYKLNLAEKTGGTHNYLGMDFNYSVRGEIHVNMDEYLDQIISGFSEEITEVAWCRRVWATSDMRTLRLCSGTFYIQ